MILCGRKKSAFLCFLELMKNQMIPPLAPILLPQPAYSQPTWPAGCWGNMGLLLPTLLIPAEL